MKKDFNSYLVITKVDGKEYITKVEATSMLDAEMSVRLLGQAVGDTHSVDTAFAYDMDLMKAPIFIKRALRCETVSMKELQCIIEKRTMDIMEGR